MDFISRDHVIAIVREHGDEVLLRKIEALFAFPAPNPTGANGRNAMGQTEDQFWDAAEKQG